MFNNFHLKTVKQFIENEIDDELKKQFNILELKHNHPPLRFKVEDCEYCKKYGNVFEIS